MVATFWSDRLKHIALLLASRLSCFITLSITLWHLCFLYFLNPSRWFKKPYCGGHRLRLGPEHRLCPVFWEDEEGDVELREL